MSTALVATAKALVSSEAHGECGSFEALVAISSPVRQLDPRYFEGINWDRLHRHARHHSLTPLLAHRLLESRASVPAPARRRLKEEFRSNLLRNFAFVEEISRILRACREHGIDALPYKGPVMAEHLWGSFALRECSDLDLLVRRADVDRAGDVLRDLGYLPVAPVTDSLREAFLRNASEEQFRHRDTNILLELQWAPAPRTLAVSFAEEEIWRNPGSISVAGEHVPVASPEQLLGLLAIHGWKHNWSKLIWVADVAALVLRYKIDWTAAYEQANRRGWRRILMLAHEMVRLVYGVIPDELPTADAEICSLAQRLYVDLQQGKNKRYLEWHRDMLCARDSRTDQLRQLVNFIFTPGLAEYSARNLPGWASPVYRAQRLGRVIGLTHEKAARNCASAPQ